MYNNFFQNASLHFWALVLTAAVFYVKYVFVDPAKEKQLEQNVIEECIKKDPN
tara:strand:+ start:339 stop:497 length:159 start_codon:yes stop_codon:yes gene_type:complete